MCLHCQTSPSIWPVSSPACGRTGLLTSVRQCLILLNSACEISSAVLSPCATDRSVYLVPFLTHCASAHILKSQLPTLLSIFDLHPIACEDQLESLHPLSAQDIGMCHPELLTHKEFHKQPTLVRLLANLPSPPVTQILIIRPTHRGEQSRTWLCVYTHVC